LQKYNIFFKYTTLHRQIDQLLGLEERFGEVAAEGEHLRLVLERGQLGGQITALKADNPVGECISLFGGDVFPHDLLQIGQRHDGATHYKVEFPLLVFHTRMDEVHVFQADGLRNLPGYLYLLPDAVQQQKADLREKHGQRHTGKPAAGSYVDDGRTGLKTDEPGNGKRMQNVVEVKIIDILTGNDVYPGVPVGV